jgi:hypothetical protein
MQLKIDGDADMSMEIILLTHTVITILGFGGLIYWMNRQTKALMGAVSAQEATIKAQSEQIKSQGEIFKGFESLINTVKMISDTTDSPKMLERLKADRAMLEEEMDAKRKKHLRDNGYDVERLRDFSKFSENVFKAFLEAMAYAPISNRKAWIDSIFVPSSYLSVSAVNNLMNQFQVSINIPPLPNDTDWDAYYAYILKNYTQLMEQTQTTNP